MKNLDRAYFHLFLNVREQKQWLTARRFSLTQDLGTTSKRMEKRFRNARHQNLGIGSTKLERSSHNFEMRDRRMNWLQPDSTKFSSAKLLVHLQLRCNKLSHGKHGGFQVRFVMRRGRWCPQWMMKDGSLRMLPPLQPGWRSSNYKFGKFVTLFWTLEGERVFFW